MPAPKPISVFKVICFKLLESCSGRHLCSLNFLLYAVFSPLDKIQCLLSIVTSAVCEAPPATQELPGEFVKK